MERYIEARQFKLNRRVREMAGRRASVNLVLPNSLLSPCNSTLQLINYGKLLSKEPFCTLEGVIKCA
jgi:hypothetical protein